MTASARPPRGEARRLHILEAAIRLAGEEGPAALTHRRVAQEAGVPLAATTYWFASKDELVREAYRLVADRDVARIRAVAEGLAAAPLQAGEDLAERLAALTARELHAERANLLASYALWLEAARNPALREVSVAWTDAYLGLARQLLTAAGSPEPELDARLLVGALDGLLLEQLSRDEPDFAAAVLEPALARLIARLTSGPNP